jgi:hypothetical protein
VLLAVAFGWVVGRSLGDLAQHVERKEASHGEETSAAVSTASATALRPALAAVAELDGRLYHILVGAYGSERADSHSLWGVAFTADE